MKIALTMSYDPGHAAVQLALTTAGSWNLTNPQVGSADTVDTMPLSHLSIDA